MAITGAASGIGRSTAEEGARAGAKVIIADVSSAQGERVSSEITDSGGDAIFVRCDVTTEDDCRRLAEATIDRYGKLTGLITCAGILQGASIE